MDGRGEDRAQTDRGGENLHQVQVYEIKKPSLVDQLWRLQDTEPARRMRKDGVLVPRRRGLGSSRLHLSSAAEERGERTDLLSQVTGIVTVELKVPAKQRTMPQLTMLFSVSTLNKTGHIDWAKSFAPRTAAALRKQMETHLRSMVESAEYPTLTESHDEELLAVATDSVLPPPPAEE